MAKLFCLAQGGVFGAVSHSRMHLRGKAQKTHSRLRAQATAWHPGQSGSTLRSVLPVVSGPQPAKRDYLILDSGAGIHSVQDRRQLTGFSSLNPIKVQAYGGAVVELQGHGQLLCTVPSDRGSSAVNHPRVEVLPSGPPLASISSLTDLGFVFAFLRTHAVMVHPDGSRTRCNRVGEHYHLDISAKDQSASVTEVAYAATDNSLRDELLLMHRAMAHASSTKMLTLSSEKAGRKIIMRPALTKELRTIQSFSDLCPCCAL